MPAGVGLIGTPTGGFMKKIALISTAAIAASLLAAPVANAAVGQTLKVTIDGKSKNVTVGTKKKPKTVKMTVSTGTTGTSDSGELDPITYAKINLPKGIALNYKKGFDACSNLNAALCTSKTKIGSGTAAANVKDIDYTPKGTLEQHIGTGGKLLIRVQFEKPAVIDETLVGKVSTKKGAYSFDFNVPEILQVPLPPDGVEQLVDFTTNFDKKTATFKKKKYGLIELTSCPKGGFKFTGEFKYRSGSTAKAAATVSCKTPKKGKKKSSKR